MISHHCIKFLVQTWYFMVIWLKNRYYLAYLCVFIFHVSSSSIKKITYCAKFLNILMSWQITQSFIHFLCKCIALNFFCKLRNESKLIYDNWQCYRCNVMNVLQLHLWIWQKLLPEAGYNVIYAIHFISLCIPWELNLWFGFANNMLLFFFFFLQKL